MRTEGCSLEKGEEQKKTELQDFSIHLTALDST